MDTNSHSKDFMEVLRTKHVKKRLIKSRVLSKLLFSLSIGEICQLDLPFSEDDIIFIRSLSGIQLTELSCMLISDFAVDISVGQDMENNEFKANKSLGRIIAQHFISEWVLSCSNDYRIIYDEHSKGLTSNILRKLIQATPLALKEFENELATSELITFDYDRKSFDCTVLNAKHLFRQDSLIINAISAGASLPQLKQFFSNHRLCDSRSVAVIKKLYTFKECNKNIAQVITQTITDEFKVMEAQHLENKQNNEEFLSKLYNLLASILERFDVSFSDSWSAMRSSSGKNTIRSHK
jgi:hypothetical protein